MQTRSAIIDLGQGQGKPLPDLKSVYSQVDKGQNIY